MNSHFNIKNCIKVYRDSNLLYVIREHTGRVTEDIENEYPMMIFDLNNITGISFNWEYNDHKTKYNNEDYIPVSTVYFSNGRSLSFEGIKKNDLKDIFEQFKLKTK